MFANVVLGTNFFSDFAASFTDTFGGTSDTYQGKLDKIYNEVIEKLSKKTLAIGCNAIIGFKIDFDEISGKGVSMFMVNAVGTAWNTWGEVSVSLELNAIIQEFLVCFPIREKLWFRPKSHQNPYKNGTFR